VYTGNSANCCGAYQCAGAQCDTTHLCK
jgi:hypothetical protein